MTTPDPAGAVAHGGSMGPVSRPVRPAPGLSLDLVVATALRLARAEGLEGVAVRRVAAELGVTPMALYRHVASREELLLHLLDVVADGVEVPGPGTPRERITAGMLAVHHAFRVDPWVVQVLASEGLASPRILPLVEVLFDALRTTGLDHEQARQAYGLLFHYTYGEALVSHGVPMEAQGRRILAEADARRFPALAAVLAGSPAVAPDAYAANLGRLLDGVLPG